MQYNRDRFVLSNGHACALLYTMLHLTGYDVAMDDLKARVPFWLPPVGNLKNLTRTRVSMQRFRKVGSKTPGHPESHETPGVEVTTGPLGQGTRAWSLCVVGSPKS